MGQAGVLALGAEVTPALFRRWLGQARAFAAEWAELRAVHQNQLAGSLARTPLQVRRCCIGWIDVRIPMSVSGRGFAGFVTQAGLKH